jgi:hypothetical protein
LYEEQNEGTGRHRFELIGESLREIGVLLMVFVPLDAAFYQGSIGFIALLGLIFLACAGLALLIAGTLLEERG